MAGIYRNDERQRRRSTSCTSRSGIIPVMTRAARLIDALQIFRQRRSPLSAADLGEQLGVSRAPPIATSRRWWRSVLPSRVPPLGLRVARGIFPAAVDAIQGRDRRRGAGPALRDAAHRRCAGRCGQLGRCQAGNDPAQRPVQVMAGQRAVGRARRASAFAVPERVARGAWRRTQVAVHDLYGHQLACHRVDARAIGYGELFGAGVDGGPTRLATPGARRPSRRFPPCNPNTATSWPRCPISTTARSRSGAGSAR